MNQRIRFPWESEGEKLVIETPEQTRVEYEIAPFGQRMGAAIYDKIFVLIVSIGIFLGFVILLAALGDEDAWGLALALALSAQYLFSVFYAVYSELRRQGQTYGKRKLGLRVLMQSGHPVTFGPSLIRNLARPIDEFPLLWLVMGFSSGCKRIGDHLAGTVVVIERSETARPARGWLDRLAPRYEDLVEKRYFFSSEMSAKLFPDDLNLIEYLEERLEQSPEHARRAALQEVAARYADRLGMVEQKLAIRADPERFLQELGLFLRHRFDEQAY